MADQTNIHDLEGQRHTGVESQSSNWMLPMQQKLRVLKKRPLRTSIFKVPHKLRSVDEEAYGPRIVSIGPFHSSTITISVLPQTSLKREDRPQTSVNVDHNPPQTSVEKEENPAAKEEDKLRYTLSLVQQTPIKKHDHLLAMEEHKWWYIIYLLNRMKKTERESSKPKPKEIFARCGEAILDQDKKVRGRYAENIKFDSNQLAEVMLVDGCFILELFLRFRSQQDVTGEDPIFRNAWMLPTFRRDLALLENQIPFFILEELFNIVACHFPRHLPCSITDLALSFFHPGLNLNQESIRMQCSQGDTPLHLLDLLHKFYLLTYPETNLEGRKTWEFKKCATKLLEAGIDFIKGKEDHLLDISFDKGVITIPPLRVDEITKSLLRNLIAYEQCRGSAQQLITSYTILLGSLIRSSPDVELLQKREIITYDLNEIEDVLTFFKNISRGVVPEDFYFGELCDKVNAYQKSWWHWHRLKAFLMVRCHRYMVELINKYLSSPWTFISFIAAFVLLSLTIVQTIYAVLSYRHIH